MPEEEDWALHGPYADKTLIRNHLAYNVAGMMSTRYAPKTRLVELFITDAESETLEEARQYKYHGVYVLTENHQKRQ